MKPRVPVAIVIAALLFGGCSMSQIINTGGATKCKDFITQDEKKQTDEVSKMLKDKGVQDKSGAEATTAEVVVARSAVVTYCETVGRADPDSKITEAPSV
jgi:acid stress chaperone HdeA